MAINENKGHSPLARYERIKAQSAAKWKVNTYVANEFEFMKSVLKYRKCESKS